jgi:uncharacterized protein
MLNRELFASLEDELAHTPAVALLGPRQVGKTTLALELADKHPGSIYLDLESEADRFKLSEPEIYLSEHIDKLVILDEVHRAPGLFPILRGMIDRARRRGYRAGRYLLLGSASLDLLKQSGESLAGRIAYLELGGLLLPEVGEDKLDTLWLRGGFPESFTSASHARSLTWRQNFIRTYLERDIPQFGPRIAAETLRRFWTMLAHHQSGLLNVAQLARNLGVDGKTAASYIDLLCDLLLVRRLQPWHDNLGKRLVKSPKTYVRDTGLLHALLTIGTREQLLGHPVIGASWEGFCIETAIASAPRDTQAYFYRASGGAEIDLLLALPNEERWAIEVKRSLTPKIERGFHSACDNVKPARKFVVYPGKERFSLGHDIEAVSLAALCATLRATNNSR